MLGVANAHKAISQQMALTLAAMRVEMKGMSQKLGGLTQNGGQGQNPVGPTQEGDGQVPVGPVGKKGGQMRLKPYKRSNGDKREKGKALKKGGKGLKNGNGDPKKGEGKSTQPADMVKEGEIENNEEGGKGMESPQVDVNKENIPPVGLVEKPVLAGMAGPSQDKDVVAESP